MSDVTNHFLDATYGHAIWPVPTGKTDVALTPRMQVYVPITAALGERVPQFLIKAVFTDSSGNETGSIDRLVLGITEVSFYASTAKRGKSAGRKKLWTCVTYSAGFVYSTNEFFIETVVNEICEDYMRQTGKLPNRSDLTEKISIINRIAGSASN